MVSSFFHNKYSTINKTEKGEQEHIPLAFFSDPNFFSGCFYNRP